MGVESHERYLYLQMVHGVSNIMIIQYSDESNSGPNRQGREI